MRTRTTLTVLAIGLAVASCSSGGDDDASDQTSATDATGATGNDAAPDESPDDSADSAADDSTDNAADDVADEADPEPETESGGADLDDVTTGRATLTLENGETFDVEVFCTLEPQIAAGSEILFTATSLGDPILDITQFGDEGPVTDIASVSVVNGDTFESLWGASTIYEPFGGALELTLDGNTIRGTGDFYPGDDPVEGGDPVPGDVVAEC